LFAACDDYFPEGVTDNIGQSLEARKIRSLYRVDPITLEECANIQRKSDESDFERMLKGDGGEGDAVGEGDEKEDGGQDGGQDGSEDDSEDEDEDGSDDTFNILSPFLSPRERLLQRRQERLKRLYDDDSDDDDTPLQLPEASLKDILKELDKKVIGQEEAKHTVALAIRDHLVRIKNSDKKINKTNIILCGPSGCGKTEIARTVSAYLKVPMVVEDITTFTETGYKGRDFIEILDDLLCAADGNVAKAQIGIVYLDEFDKLGARSGDSNHDNHQLSTQNGLLKLAEGAVYNLKRDVTFDTSNVLFIASGCFPNLTSPEKVKKKAAIGFSASERESVDATEYSSPEGAEKITAEMLVKSGFLLELIGRFPVIARLESLSVNDVVRIIREPENSVLEQYRSLYGCMGVDLNFSDEMLTDIAKRAVGQNIGARGLKTVFEEVIRSVAFDIPEEPATVDFYLADDGSYAHTVTLKPKEKPCPVTVCRGDGIGDGIDDGNIDG
ncbi:MAG: AAA family ATPase, partial [Clostridia bacterium]|nr:AAA family ATPase [Clostridia bacterium]